ncbi:13482_t:CDS:2, partial [Racocetra fulgida]
SPMQDITNNNNDNAQDSNTSASTINVLLSKNNGVENTPKQDDTIENNAQDSSTLNNT